MAEERIVVNPDAEVSAFAPVRPGTYRMRISEVEDRRPEKEDLHIILVHTMPANELTGIDGEPLKGQASSVHDYLQLAPDKQWKLRSVVEAAGMEWGDFMPSDLKDKEVELAVTTETYNDQLRNRAGRYVKA